ncbi:hypothetical protein B0T17DRAFT_594556 [Bombardia bombarda]|uniref:Myb-like DNA-binding domain-containing protein n=1 Tax=Bombardia bombarda TaxID=252184 RepID=A0AA39XK42_9PEZI|nr:hypothetical protein B0T17DRAFT_594556 [Bombardia bombarda]
MPPHKTPEILDGRPQPTAQEAILFFSIIRNMKTKPEIDWKAVAQEAKLKNAETAKVRFGQIKRKLGIDSNSSSGDNSSSGGVAAPKTKATPKKASVTKKVPTPRRANTKATKPTARTAFKSSATVKTEDSDDEVPVAAAPNDDEDDDDEEDDHHPQTSPVKHEVVDINRANIRNIPRARRSPAMPKNSSTASAPVVMSPSNNSSLPRDHYHSADAYSVDYGNDMATSQPQVDVIVDDEEDDDDAALVTAQLNQEAQGMQFHGQMPQPYASSIYASNPYLHGMATQHEMNGLPSYTGMFDDAVQWHNFGGEI